MPLKREELDREKKAVEIISGSLVGLGVIAVVQMLSINTLDLPLKVSITSFAVSIPTLSAVVLCVIDENTIGFTTDSNRLIVLLVIGSLASLIGVGGLFFHFMNFTGVVFGVSAVIGFILWFQYNNALRNLQKQ